MGRAKLRVAGGRVLTPGGWIDGDVLVAGGRIARVERSRGRPAAGPTIDAGGLLVAPGLIDLQVNGGFGRDFTSDPRTIWHVGARLPRYGVTAFLPTIISAPAGTVENALRALDAGSPPGYRGAAPLGLHCEGPMLAPSRRGAHEARHLRLPSKKLIGGWNRASGVRMVTLAPELRGASSVIPALAASGVVVSAGHSNATYDQARRAFNAGVSAGTHLFNAMSGFGHREPGLAGALLSGEAIVGLIADGVHVHPAAVDVAWHLKGPRRIALVTDAAAPMGARAGRLRHLGDTDIRVRGGAPRTPDGALAGSLLTLDAAVRNVMAFTRCDPEDALSAASATPAALLGEAGRGRIQAGCAADLVLLDARLRVVATVVGGHVVFDRRRRAGPDSSTD